MKSGCVEGFRLLGWLEQPSPQMALRECAAGTRFQVMFKRHRAAFVREFYDHIDTPRPAGGGVRTPSSVVRGKSRRNVPGQPGVVAIRIALALEDVDETLGCVHAIQGAQGSGQATRLRNRNKFVSRLKSAAGLAACRSVK